MDPTRMSSETSVPKKMTKTDMDVELSTHNEDANPQNGNDKSTWLKKYAGMLLMLFGSFCFALIVLFVKILKDYKYDAYGAAFWRYAGITLPSIPLLIFYEWGPGNKKKKEGASIFDTVWPINKDDNWKTLLGLMARGLIGTTGNILRYYALQYLSIGDTLSITYSSPIFVTFLAHYFLKEKCGIVPVIITFTTLGGVIIISRPPLLTGAEAFDTDTLIGVCLALGSLFSSSVSIVITRKLREVHFSLMLITFGVIGIIQATVLALSLGHLSFPTGLFESFFVLGVAGFSFLGMMVVILALKFENAGPIALLRSCDVIFGFILQFFFLNVVPDVYSSIGGTIVLLGVLVTGWRKYISTLTDGDSRRSTWSWIIK